MLAGFAPPCAKSIAEPAMTTMPATKPINLLVIINRFVCSDGSIKAAPGGQHFSSMTIRCQARLHRNTVATHYERRGVTVVFQGPLTSILSPQVMGEAEKIDTVAKVKFGDSAVARCVLGKGSTRMGRLALTSANIDRAVRF